MVPDMFSSAPLPKWVSVIIWLAIGTTFLSGLIGLVRATLWMWSKVHVTFG